MGKPRHIGQRGKPRAPVLEPGRRIKVMPDDAAKRGIGSVVAVGAGQSDISKRWRAEPIGILQPVRHRHMTGVPDYRVPLAGSPRSEMRQHQRVELLIGQKRPRMAAAASDFTIKQLQPGQLAARQRRPLARKIRIKGAVSALIFGRLKRSQGVGDMRYIDVERVVHIIEGGDELRGVLRDNSDPFGQDRPDCVDPVVSRARHLIFLWIARHFELRGQRKQGLNGKNAVETLRKPFLSRRIEPIFVDVRHCDPAIVKERVNFFGPQVPKRRCVARDALGDAFCAGAWRPLRANAYPPLTYSKRQTVGAGVIGAVTGATGNISIARQDRVEKQQLTQFDLQRVETLKVRGLQWARKVGPIGWRTTKHREKRPQMKPVALVVFLCLCGPALAEIETARDAMDAGDFVAAMAELLPAARAGNAEAEELIGVMYASGLGVERDDVRAFDWYLRASMKGHPGAQSGVGWYYEVGRGMPAPDLVRVYMWYVLSAIGGDPDAAISHEEVVKKMTQAQIDQAHNMIDDYRTWLYPFR